jgi:hypothetical protein
MTENTDLNINDLMQLRQIIELATQRGAFQASELSSVGTVYDKLTGFLSSISAQAQEATSQGDIQ